MKKMPLQSAVNSFHDAFYHEKLSQHGIFSAQAVGWTDYLQSRLFDKISLIFQGVDTNAQYTLLDVGCGLGDFIQHLKNENITFIEYYGIDKLYAMVKNARIKYPGYRFTQADLLALDPTLSFDFIISSGSLNILLFNSPAKHFDFVKRFIATMYKLCRYACSFNLLSIQGKYFFPDNDRFFYADKAKVENFCRDFCTDVEVINESHGFVFTVCLFKNRQEKPIIM